MDRRLFLGAIATGSITSACSQLDISAIDSIYSASKYVIKGDKDVTLSRQQINNIKYATCYARLGTNPRVLLVLSHVLNGDQYWISADRNVVVTNAGFVIKTHGLSSNLKNTHYQNETLSEVFKTVMKNGNYGFSKLVDFSPQNQFNIKVESNFSLGGTARLTIAELTFDTIIVIEESKAPSIGWEYRNTYWVDQHTGQIWQSIQHFSPFASPLIISILKPLVA